jgi:lysyl-tRNA synthetase class 2
MSTLTRRDLGPDKEAAEMSDSDEAGHVDTANLPTVEAAGPPAPAEPEHFADRRRHHAWVPGSAALLTMLVGLSDIIAIFKPGWPHRLHRLSHFVPGTLTNVTRSADVIIGLMLLLLAHGLRRRKRRAWQAVAALLAFDIGIHFYHSQHVPTAVVAIVLLIALIYFRDEFYAEGDQRNRWRALRAIVALVVADVAIGLTYILLARGL